MDYRNLTPYQRTSLNMQTVANQIKRIAARYELGDFLEPEAIRQLRIEVDYLQGIINTLENEHEKSN